MVFLIPGAIFRRLLFSGKFSKHFESGNAFERLIWNLVSGVSILAVCILVFYAFKRWGNVNIWRGPEVDCIIASFQEMYKSNFPQLLDNSNSIKRIAVGLGEIYVISAFLGFFIYRLIKVFNLDNTNSILLGLQGSWHRLIISNKKVNRKHRIGSLYYTVVDIKTLDGILYTGQYHDIIYNQDNIIDAIVLKDVYIFKVLKSDQKAKIKEIKKRLEAGDSSLIFHEENAERYIYKRRVKGDFLSILGCRIDNICITYVRLTRAWQRVKKLINWLYTLTSTALILLSMVYIFIDFQIFDFQNKFSRFTFCVSTMLNTIIFYGVLITLFNLDEKDREPKRFWMDLLNYLVFLVFFSIMYLHSFSILSFGAAILTMIVWFIAMAFIMTPSTAKPN